MTISQNTQIQKITANSIIGVVTDFNSAVISTAYSKATYHSGSYPKFTGTATYGISGNQSPASTTTGWTNPNAIPSGQLDNKSNNPQLPGITDCLTYIPNDIKLKLDPLNATVVGSPTMSNGIVSGFSSANYLTLPKAFNPLSTPWEEVICFTTGSDITTEQTICCNNVPYWGYGVTVVKGKIQIGLTDSTSSFAMANNQTITASANTRYYVKMTFNGSNYTSTYSTNGVTWLNIFSLDSTKTIVGNTRIMGINDDKRYPFKGKIDLSQSYIKVNGSIWWQGGTGQVTLKKGSKVYVPNGFESDGTTKKFDEFVVENDISTQGTGGSTSKYPLTYGSNRAWSSGLGLDYFSGGNIYSGSTQPTVGAGNSLWYDTANNKMKTTSDGGSTWIESRIGLPFCIVTSNGGTITSINQTFNGMGYIGSTMFVLPGIKGIIPNGSTNINYENPTVSLITVGTPGARDLFIKSNNALVDRYYHNQTTQPTITWCAWYNPSTNTYKESTSDSAVFTDEQMLFIANFTDDNASPQSKITSLTPRPLTSTTITASTLWNSMLNLTRTLVKIRKFTSNWYHKTDSTNNLVNTITSYATFNTYYPSLTSATLAVNVKGEYWTRSGSTSVTISPTSVLKNNAIATSENINTAINNCYNAWVSTCYNANVLTYTFYTCHQNCHSQCHSSRGRR